MFYSAFDDLLPVSLREVNKPLGGLLPAHLKEKIDEMNEWVYSDLNTGVYKAGFASSQTMYEENVVKVFKALDGVENILEENGGGKYLFGDVLTEADIRLYPTIVRFDVAYYSLFQCNLRMIRFAYPRIQKWLTGLFYSEEESIRGASGVKTTVIDHVSAPFILVLRGLHSNRYSDRLRKVIRVLLAGSLSPWDQILTCFQRRRSNVSFS
jgi:putative glutathione S-transferase